MPRAKGKAKARCGHPGCSRPALTSLDFLEVMDPPLLAIAVGKFEDAALQQFCRPGDRILTQAGDTLTYRGPSEPCEPFQGEGHRL